MSGTERPAAPTGRSLAHPRRGTRWWVNGGHALLDITLDACDAAGMTVIDQANTLDIEKLRARSRRREAGCYIEFVDVLTDRVTIGSPATMHMGPLGSQVHVLQADAGTVTALAAVDWNRWFGRVCLDPVRGLVVLMTPSHLHEDLTGIFDDIVDAAANVSKRLGSTRVRGRDEPPGTGMEPDCAFYLDERARGYRAAAVESEAAAASFVERTPFDLVVEVEITNADEGKIERYGEIGVRELWRLHGRKGTRDLRADFFALHPGRPPRRLAASAVLAGLTPGDVCEAADSLRLCLTRDERTEAVARIVRRRRRANVRVREAKAPYAAPPGQELPRDVVPS